MAEKIPDGGMPDWDELKDEEIDPGIRQDLLELAKIDEEKFWSYRELGLRLQGEPTFAPSLWLGLRMLLESHGLAKKGEVMEKFDQLSDSFTGQKKASLDEQIKDVQELRKYLSTLGFSENELSAKETLKRAYFGYVNRKDEEALKMLHQAAKEDPALKRALEEFDKEAREREGKERGPSSYL